MATTGKRSVALPFCLFVISPLFLWNVEGQNLITHDVSAIRGETAIFSCRVRNSDDRIQFVDRNWITIYIKNVKYATNERFQLVTFTENELQVSLSNVSLSDEGYYICLHYSSDLEEAYGHLTVLVLPGSPVIESREDVFREGNQVKLTCTSTGGKPAASIRWMKGEEEVTGETTHQEAYDKTFNVVSHLKMFVTKEDDGVAVKCILDHPAIRGLVAQRLLEVLYKPEVKIVATRPDGLTREGDNLDLTCVVKGNPHPHRVQWLRVDGAVLSHAGMEGPALHIENLTRHHNGTYRCLASNARGEAYEDYILNVVGTEAYKGPGRNIHYDIIPAVVGVAIFFIVCVLTGLLGRYLASRRGSFHMQKVEGADADRTIRSEVEDGRMRQRQLRSD